MPVSCRECVSRKHIEYWWYYRQSHEVFTASAYDNISTLIIDEPRAVGTNRISKWTDAFITLEGISSVVSNAIKIQARGIHGVADNTHDGRPSARLYIMSDVGNIFGNQNAFTDCLFNNGDND